jgi:hypothetical protein
MEYIHNNSILDKLRYLLRSHYLDVAVIVLVVLDTFIVTIQMIIDLETATRIQIPNLESLKLTAKSDFNKMYLEIIYMYCLNQF